ncbi:hypothetical protein M970_101080 [Encephalitozoon cuniculi EcunIII-L]|nr:hypothetical protein M970_101080 [Encephalitozoon cuniculi EcunIII-L]
MAMFGSDPCSEDRGRSASIGTFDRFYRLSRNFIADLVHLGPILVSVTVERDFSRVLVRSMLGFREYRFYSQHITGCPYFFSVSRSLSRYFGDTIGGWRYVEAASARRRSSFMGMLSSLFSLGNWPLRSDLGAKRKKMYDATCAGMMRCPEKFSVGEVMGRMAEVRLEHARGLDWEFYNRPVYIDLVVENSKVIPRGMLGRRLVDPEDCCNVSSDDLEDIKTSVCTGEKRLRQALLGFVFNEVEYFCQVNRFYMDVASKAWGEEAGLEDIFEGFCRVHRFEAGFISSMGDIVEGAGFAMDRILQDPQYFADAMDGRGFSEIEMDDEEILEKVLCSFEGNFEGFRCYEDLMLSHEESIETLRNAKNYAEAPDHRAVNDCFCNCLQRVVRYPILIDDILRNLDDGAHAKRARKIYLRMTRLINIIDKKKERHDNLRCALLIGERVGGMPSDVGKERKDFLFQLNCEDTYGDPVALFLFREMVVVADREGPSVSILDSGSGRYFFRCALRLENAEIVAFGATGIKIIVKDVLEGRDDLYQMTEVYDDVSIGAMYFLRCSPHSVRCFVEEYYRAGAEAGGDLYTSGTNIFFRVLDYARAEEDSLGKADLVLYMSEGEFKASRRANAACINLEGGTLKTKSSDGVEQCVCYGESELKDRLGEVLEDIVRVRRILVASESTPWGSPHLFATYRIKLREIVEECGDSSVTGFNGSLSKCDMATITQKVNVARGIMGYLSRSLSYVGCKSTKKDSIPDGDQDSSRLGPQEAIGLLERLLDMEEIEDCVFTEYSTQDILCLLMHFVHTDVYSFFRMEDIEILHRTLVVDGAYLLGMVVPKMSNPSFASSLFEIIVTARDKVCIAPALEMLLGMFASFEVSRAEVIDVVAKICW